MKFAIVLLALVATCMAACNTRRVRDEFESYKRQYRKAYTSAEEEAMRCAIFAENLAQIEGHNLMMARDASITWTLTVNKFTDYTTEEFISIYGGLDADSYEEAQRSVQSVFVPDPNYKASLAKDWRSLGKVTLIKNQAKCGSCWAFGAVGVVESAYAIKYNELLDLSEQQVIECASGTTYNNFACNGGLPARAYDWWVKSGGVTLEANYPYISGDGKNGTACKSTTQFRNIKITGYTTVSKSESGIIQALDTIGPINVAVRAGHISWQAYGGGVLCDSKGFVTLDKQDHAVIAVGYNEKSYIVKNSWGETWGEQGYVYLCRSISNNSGISGSHLLGIAPNYVTVA